MRFTRKSIVTRVWVSLVVAGTYKREEVPKLFNLRDVVYEVLDELAGDGAED